MAEAVCLGEARFSLVSLEPQASDKAKQDACGQCGCDKGGKEAVSQTCRARLLEAFWGLSCFGFG